MNQRGVLAITIACGIAALASCSAFDGADVFGESSASATTAVALVQQATATGAGVSSLTVALPAAPANGDALILSLDMNVDDAPSAVTGGGVTWILAAHSCQHTCNSVWAGFGASGGGRTITLSLPSAQDIAASVSEWSGLTGLDVAGSRNGESSPISTPLPATSQANELVFASVADDNVAIGSPGNGFSALASAAIRDTEVAQAYRIVSSQGSYGTSWTESPAGWWDSDVVAFKAKAESLDAGADSAESGVDAGADGGVDSSTQAGPALVQQATATGSGVATLTIALPRSPAMGDALILSLNMSVDDAPSAVQGGGVTWMLASRSCQHTCNSVWAGFASSGGASSIVLTLPSAQDIAASVSEWSGLVGLGNAANNNGESSPVVTPGVSTTQPGALVFASVADDKVTLGAPSNGFVALPGAAVNDTEVAQAYRITPATGSYATSWTESPAGWWDCDIVSFQVGRAASDAGSGDSGGDAGTTESLIERVEADAGTTQDYYVSTTGSDSNAGTATAPWATIAFAATQVGPGARVHVAPGTYDGSINSYASGTADHRIVFLSDTTWGATLVSSSSSNGWDNYGDYVDIVGFEAAGGAATVGLHALGNSDRIVGNHVHGVQNNVACNSNGGAGIKADGPNTEVLGNFVHDNGPYPTWCDYFHGIYLGNTSNPSTGSVVSNNLSFRNSGWGIQMWHESTSIVIVNNTVFGNLSGGIVVGASDGYTNDDTAVNDNIVYANARGIFEEGTTGTHNVYDDNLVFQNALGDWSLQNGNTASATVSGAPQFVNDTGDASGDYHLLGTSPAINAGTSLDAPSYDDDGVTRPVGSAWDIGAYEYH